MTELIQDLHDNDKTLSIRLRNWSATSTDSSKTESKQRTPRDLERSHGLPIQDYEDNATTIEQLRQLSRKREQFGAIDLHRPHRRSRKRVRQRRNPQRSHREPAAQRRGVWATRPARSIRMRQVGGQGSPRGFARPRRAPNSELPEAGPEGLPRGRHCRLTEGRSERSRAPQTERPKAAG